MTRRIKVVIAASGVVAVLAAGAVPALDRVLTRRYERRLKEAVRARYGGELSLTRFRVSALHSRASVQAFRYEDPPGTYRVTVSGGPTVVEIQGLSLDPKVIRFRAVSLDHPVLSVVRTPQGDWDRGMPGVARELLDVGLKRARKVLGLGESAPRKTPSEAEEPERKRRVIEMGTLTIRGAKVTYEDHRFTATPIKLTLRDFNFEGTDLSSADIWGTLLTSDADGVLEIGPQRIDIRGRTQDVAGEPKKLWSLEARGIDLAPLAGPVLAPVGLHVSSGAADVRLSHLFDLSLARRSAFVIDYDIGTTALSLEVREVRGPAALLRGAAERAKAYVDEREGKLDLHFSVEATPDLAVAGKQAGTMIEAIGKLTWHALQRSLLRSIGLEGER